jgi:hypothetical protein
LRIVGYQSRQLRICPRVRKRREHGDLSDMSQPDHRITDLATMFRNSHDFFAPLVLILSKADAVALADDSVL